MIFFQVLLKRRTINPESNTLPRLREYAIYIFTLLKKLISITSIFIRIDNFMKNCRAIYYIESPTR